MSKVQLLSALFVFDQSFINCNSLNSCDMLTVTTIGSATFAVCTSLVTLNLSSCLFLGPDVFDNSIFSFIIGNHITFTIPIALMTCDAGNPDGDIVTLQTNNPGLTIITV